MPESKPMQALRKIALTLPGVEEGTSCNKSAYKARGKAFLFVGMDDQSYNVMIKLSESQSEATRLAAKEPGQYTVGGHGWVKVELNHAQSPPAGLMERWIGESYRLLVAKQAGASSMGNEKPSAMGSRGKPVSKKRAAKRRAASDT